MVQILPARGGPEKYSARRGDRHQLADYLNNDAVGLASIVARREASVTELLLAVFELNDRADPKISTVCRLMDKEAQAQPEKPISGPFAGVPFLLKDIAQDYAGVPTTGGSHSMALVVPVEHAYVVRR